MLIILFGITAEMGEKSRQFFIKQNFEMIKKYTYVPEENIVKDRFGRRNECSYEDVLNCDFKYKNNDMIVGFYKEQIIDAARGRKNCFISISAETIDFIKQIKAAYGEYVTVIGSYIDEKTLRDMSSKLPDITEEELAMRLDLGRQIKQHILKERSLFDEIAIYGGEDSIFNYDALYKQYSYMIKKAENREKALNNKIYVELPYSGNENYVFVSYSSKDAPIVLPILSKLQRAGCRIWYDEGIYAGENWRKFIATKISNENCAVFLLFGSSNSVKSKNVTAEINGAIICEKKIITVRTDDSKFGLADEMYIRAYETISSKALNFDDELLKALDDSVKLSAQINNK